MTDKYAVIGNPIAHSKSPEIHTMFAQQTGQDIIYEKIEAPLDGFVATIERLREESYRGCNVTVPFKLEAFQLSTEQSERASAAQAVNTLKFDNEATLGDNTDGIGLIADIERNLNFPLHGKRILLMGAGGAARGVLLPLFLAGVNLKIYNRNVDKARNLCYGLQVFVKRDLYAKHGLQCGMPTFIQNSAELTGQQFDIVINATSTGLTDEMPQLPSKEQIPLNPPFAKGEDNIPPFAKGGRGGIFAPGALAYEMMYGRETQFMKFAREQGAAIVSDGLGMLVEQAAESFFIWRGVRPDTAPVLAKLRGTV